MPIVVLDPTPGTPTRAARMAPGRGSLDGATVGLLDNGKMNVDRFLDHVEAILRERFGVREFIRRKKPDSSRPVPSETLGELSSADAILSAIGD